MADDWCLPTSSWGCATGPCAVTLGLMTQRSQVRSLRIGFGAPQTRAKIATVGATLPVLVNPAQRDQIAVDTSHLP
jgi:hypothetical protein